MAVYTIIDANVTDEEKHAQFREQLTLVISAYGGRVLASTHNCEVVEGDWRPGRMTLVEFPDIDRYRRYISSPELGALRELRESATDGINRVMFEGL